MKRLIEGTEKKQLGESDAAYASAMGLLGAAFGILVGNDYDREAQRVSETLRSLSVLMSGMPEEFRNAAREIEKRVSEKARKLK